MTNAEKLKAAVSALCKSRYGDASPENLKKLFLSYDANKDGAIQRDELARLLSDSDVDGCNSAFFATCERWTNGVMDQVDTNRDGKITWEEYRQAAGLPKEAPPPPPPPPASDDELTSIAKEIAKAPGSIGGEGNSSDSQQQDQQASANLNSGLNNSSKSELGVAGAALLVLGAVLFLKR